MKSIKKRIREKLYANIIYSFLLFVVTMNIITVYQDYLSYWRSFIYISIIILLVYLIFGYRFAAWMTYVLLIATLPLVIYAAYILPMKLQPSFEDKYMDFTRGHEVYRRNYSRTFVFKGGIFNYCDPSVDAEMKDVVFKTDGEGFRNDTNYNGQKYVLVGDSFVVGLVTQRDTINTILKLNYGIDAYNMGVHGIGPDDYVAMIRAFRKRHGDGFRALIFMYEGNDFYLFTNVPQYDPQVSKILNSERTPLFFLRYISLIAGFERDMEKFLKSFKKGVHRRERNTPTEECPSDKIISYKIDGANMGFGKDTIQISKTTSCTLPYSVQKRLYSIHDVTEAIFYIPTNYRVYYHIFREKGEPDLPNAQWECLKKTADKLGIRVVDLTPSLIAASDELIKRHEFVYWKDDAHFNKNGNEIVAKEIAKTIHEAVELKPK